jgi:hypothetical protein
MKRHSQSHAADEANSHFKQVAAKPATDYEKAEQAFLSNGERLKAERLAREAERRGRSERTP